MADRSGDTLATWMEQRVLHRWGDIADRAAVDGLTRDERTRALALRQRIDRALRAGETGQADPPDLAPHTDWWWRPDVFARMLRQGGVTARVQDSRLSDDVLVFHDCPHGEILVRQSRNPVGEPTAHGLAVDVYGFGGSYLSLVVEFPQDGVVALRKRHVIRLRTNLATDRPIEVIARLNVEHGPNAERLVRDISMRGVAQSVDFDLIATRVDPTRVTRIWLDLIFERPHMNGLQVFDLVLSRHPRAEL